MIRIARYPRSIKPTSWPARYLTHAFSTNTQDVSSGDDGSSQLGSNLSRLLSKEQKSLLRQANQLAARSRNLARQVGNVTVREDSLLLEIVRLKNRQLVKVQGLSSNQDESVGSQSTSNIDDDSKDLPPSLFTVVFTGEFNSGKSTLINALLGEELLESGVLPTTDAITVLLGEEDTDKSVSSKQEQLDGTSSLPARLHLLPISQYPLLSDVCVIDTPGTNAIMSLQHTTSTLRILHNADLLIFVTSADRPFSESEKELLRTSITYRKRVLVVINKMDILERQKGEDHGDASKKRVIEYVTEHASELLGGRPVVIPVSGRDALSVKMLGGNKDDDGLWKRCNFGSLEHYLLDTLSASSKIKTKLLNPIGVAEGMLLDCQQELKQRIDDLDVDVMTLRLLNSQTAAWEKELKIEVMDQCRKDVNAFFVKRSQIVDIVLGQLSVVDQIKLGLGMGRSVFDDAWQDAIGQTEHAVFGKQSKNTNSQQHEMEPSLLAIAGECAESITSRAKSQGEISIEYLGKRPSVIAASKRDNMNNIVGVSRITPPKFNRLQEDLNESFMNAIQNATTRLPSNDEWASRIFSLLRKASITSSICCASTLVGPAAIFAGAADSTTAILISTTMIILGGIAIPIGNTYASKLCQKEWMSQADKLDATLDTLFKEVSRRVSTQLAESVAPYSRFVNGEGEHLSELESAVDSSLSSANILRGQINKECEL